MRALRPLPGTVAMIARMGRIMLDSRANGPGLRDVYWFTGCSIGCPGCTNPQFLAHGGGIEVPVVSLLSLVSERATAVDGITLSGGEPTEQPSVALALARHARSLGLGVVMFTGRSEAALAGFAELRDACDLVVAGPYLRSRPSTGVLLGSSNQRLLFPTGRYSAGDLEGVSRLEWQLGGRGMSETGVG